MTDMDTAPPAAGPYATAAPLYWAAGFRGVLPLPATAKTPVPRGYTGRDGAWPSYPDVQAWVEDKGAGNIALRLPPDVLGVDVDHYDSKPGGAILADLERRLGALPPTWRTTSRDDGLSGIRLYRIPAGLRWPGVLGPGIETIRHEHRYAVAWPSTHPNGGTYRWITPDGATMLGGVPHIDDLPDLPAAWVEHFTHGEMATEQPKAGLTESTSAAWLTERGTGSPCRRVDTALERGMADMASGGSRHDAALALTNRLVWLAGEGHPGAAAALNTAGAWFVTKVGADRGDDEARSEWDRMVLGAIDLAAAAWPTPTNTDPCTDPFAGLITKEKPCPTPNPPAPAATPQETTDTAPTASVGSVPASADGLDPERLQQFYLEELARITGRTMAQAHYEKTHRDDVIADKVRRRVLDDEAKVEHKRLTEPPAPPFDVDHLGNILARPEDPPMRADGLIPWEGSALVVAQRKTGKTTLLLNWGRSLIEGDDFLGEYPVRALEPGERVAMLNYEVSAAQAARWADEVGLNHDRFLLANLRGRRNPLAHPDDRAQLAAYLRERNVKSLIVDPFGRAYTGVSQNDNGEVQAFLLDLDLFARSEVGALDLMLATHAGWDGERTRGASALEDWGDVIINLTRDEQDDTKRYMKAQGRDVEVDEDELFMDPLTRYLSRTGNGGRSQRGTSLAKVAKFVTAAVQIITASPGLSGEAVKRELQNSHKFPRGGSGNNLITDVLKSAEREGLIVTEPGLRSGYTYFPAVGKDTLPPTPPNPSSPLPGGVQSTTPPALYRRSSGGAGRTSPIAGGALTYDHATGNTYNTQTGEIVGGA